MSRKTRSRRAQAPGPRGRTPAAVAAGRRVRPKPRLPGLQPVYDVLIDRSSALVAVDHALDAELWLGAQVAGLRAHAPTDEAWHLAMLDLIDEAEWAGPRPQHLLLLSAMAAMCPQAIAESAARAAARLVASTAARGPRSGDWADPAVARMIAFRIVDISIGVLGFPPDRIGPTSIVRLFAEALPASLTAPDIVLRQSEQVVSEWVAWLTGKAQKAPDVPRKARGRLRLATVTALRLYPRQCRDRRVSPHFPYVADLPIDQAGGDEIQKVLNRRMFAVPFPGQRGDGVVDLPRPAGGLPAGQTHVDDLDAADAVHRELINAIGQTALGVHHDRISAWAAVVEQLWNDQPTAVWQTAQRLADEGLPRVRILQRLADTWQRYGTDTSAPIDGDHDGSSPVGYKTALRALPGRSTTVATGRRRRS